MRSFGGALAHCFQNQIRSFEVWAVVFPSVDSRGYRQRPGSALATTAGRFHKSVRDASGLKEDPGQARMMTVVPAFGMSKKIRNPTLISSAHGQFFFGYPPVGLHRDRRVLAARLPIIHAPRCALHRSLIFSEGTERPADSCIAR